MNCIYSSLTKAFLSLLVGILIFALGARAQSSSESMLAIDNAYNPIPSPDGKYIAYVHTGWGGGVITSLGRSSLASDVKIMNVRGAAATRTLAKDFFLSGWTPDSTRLVCFRDWRYSLVSIEGRQTLAGRIPIDPNHPEFGAESVAYSSRLETIVWSRGIDRSHRVIETPDRVVARYEAFSQERVIPSPDGRYLAVFRQDEGPSGTDLRIYNLRLRSWTEMGKITVHPDNDWWYIQPDWNPWFSSGSRLVFLKDSSLIITDPEGTQKAEIRVDGHAGLPVPSPDGQSIAYAKFEPRPRKVRPDLQFWGGTTILVVSVSAGSKPHSVTAKNPDEVYDLKWLNNGELVFDRVAEEDLFQHARLWKVAVPH